MATMVPAKKNTAYTFYVGLVSQANSLILQANPTLAAGDIKVAVDDAIPANLTDIPVVDADFTKRVKVTLTTSEMNGDNITVIFSDAAGDEWCDLLVNIQTVAAQIDDIKTETANILTDTAEIGAAGAGLTAITDQTDLIPASPAAVGSAMTLANDAVSAAALKTDAVTEIVSAILAGVVEGTITLAHAMQSILAACAGKSDGGGTATLHFRDQADSKNRLTATVDSDGNRTAMTPSYD